MAKKRTGLQSDISSIFSGVPVPKKESPPPKPEAPPVKPVAPPPPEPPAEPADVKPSQPAPPPASPAKPSDIEPPQPAPIPTAPKSASVPKPKVAEPSVVAEPVKAPSEPAAPKVIETRKFEPKIQQIPTRVPRRRKDRYAATKSGVNAGRQKASIVMVVILSIALVFLLGRPYFNSRSNPAIVDTAIQTNAGITSGANVEIDWPDPPVYYPHYRDPMDPESNGRAVPKTTQDIVISGIVYSEDNPQVIVNGRYYGVGGTIKGATIVEITRNKAAFERDGKTWTQGVQEGVK